MSTQWRSTIKHSSQCGLSFVKTGNNHTTVLEHEVINVHKKYQADWFSLDARSAAERCVPELIHTHNQMHYCLEEIVKTKHLIGKSKQRHTKVKQRDEHRPQADTTATHFKHKELRNAAAPRKSIMSICSLRSSKI